MEPFWPCFIYIYVRADRREALTVSTTVTGVSREKVSGFLMEKCSEKGVKKCHFWHFLTLFDHFRTQSPVPGPRLLIFWFGLWAWKAHKHTFRFVTFWPKLLIPWPWNSGDFQLRWKSSTWKSAIFEVFLGTFSLKVPKNVIAPPRWPCVGESPHTPLARG